MLAFITNLDLSEIAIILIGAVVVFGKELPAVVIKGMQQVVKFRRGVAEMWREAGLEQEMRKVRTELEASKLPSPKSLFSESKALVEEPVQTWRKSLQTELTDVVSVAKSGPKAPVTVDSPKVEPVRGDSLAPGPQGVAPAAEPPTPSND